MKSWSNCLSFQVEVLNLKLSLKTAEQVVCEKQIYGFGSSCCDQKLKRKSTTNLNLNKINLNKMWNVFCFF